MLAKLVDTFDFEVAKDYKLSLIFRAVYEPQDPLLVTLYLRNKNYN